MTLLLRTTLEEPNFHRLAAASQRIQQNFRYILWNDKARRNHRQQLFQHLFHMKKMKARVVKWFTHITLLLGIRWAWAPSLSILVFIGSLWAFGVWALIEASGYTDLAIQERDGSWNRLSFCYLKTNAIYINSEIGMPTWVLIYGMQIKWSLLTRITSIRRITRGCQSWIYVQWCKNHPGLWLESREYTYGKNKSLQVIIKWANQLLWAQQISDINYFFSRWYKKPKPIFHIYYDATSRK